MRDLKTTTIETLTRLQDIDIIERIDNYSERFYDEPRHFYFGTVLSSDYEKILRKDYFYHSEQSIGVGISFESPYHALLKSIMEAVERFSQRSVPTDRIRYRTLSVSEQKASIFFQSEDLNFKLKPLQFGFVEGMDMITGQPAEVPAQYVYLESYHKLTNHTETLFTPDISTGTAAGFDEEKVLMTGICEIVERDALMSLYLNSVPLHPIDTRSLPFQKIKRIINLCRRYLLTPYIFIIQTDLQIPVAMTILVDKTGYGAAVSVGGGCSPEIESAIIHSIEESLAFRFLIKRKMNELRTTEFNIKQSEIIDNTYMQMYWSALDKINELSFWIDQDPLPYQHPDNPIQKLSDFVSLCKKRKIPLYNVNITPKPLQDAGIVVRRAVMPTLQPFYDDRTKPFIYKKRIETVSKKFNKHTYTLNPIPHPIP
ncbi:YcaO-like family protein [Candidatus Roizmanbacteria bacterium]|nr:MAG: YcaO-like family protein [Candidatus Roizmanbacteria bacterium]